MAGSSLTIAHRLNTVMDSDMLVVMEQGELAECGAPARMLEVGSTEYHPSPPSYVLPPLPR
eukprot:COSAG05_NODE_12968_length_446_cov_17.083573_1_plen_60_part_10